MENNKIAARMSGLEELDRSGLRVAWQKAFDNAPPHFLSMLFMRKALIWDAQCKKYGGVPANVKRALKSAADGKTPRMMTASTLRPGTQLIREWNGRRYQVDVTKDGYRYNGDDHKSLSAIALLITGTTWSGPRFFGLTRV
ncbi:MAG: DUF2924 domain-containing protein, partial [Paracoccaceae bacterium]